MPGLTMLMMRPGRPKNDGTKTRRPVLRERNQKYGRITRETCLKITSDVLIIGAHGAGKSKMIQKYAEHGAEIWGGRPVLFVRAINPVASWLAHPELQKWANREINRQGQEEAKASAAPQPEAENKKTKKAKEETPTDFWAKLPPWERQEWLVKWVRGAHVVAVIDDAHKLTGRKADLALQITRGAYVVIMSTSSEGQIPISLRLAVQDRNPQRVDLATDAAYDVTFILVWVLSLIALGAGAWPVAAALGGMNMLARGQRAAKQS